MVRAKKPGRGGPRQGQPGRTYTNRTDMNQAPRAVPGQVYGQAGAQLSSQAALPLPQGSAPPGGASPGGPPGLPPSGGPPLTPPGAPTTRPGEPLTTGIASGAGAGPEALNLPAPVTDPTVHLLQGILSRYPNRDIEALLAQAQAAQ